MSLVEEEKKKRAKDIVRYLKRVYKEPTSELLYETPFQFLIAVVLSAQCTDKHVNSVTRSLFTSFATPSDVAKETPVSFQKHIRSIPFFRNKAKALVGIARSIEKDYGGVIPRTEKELTALPGIGYKTAHVILGELYDIWEGIPTDTHVRRFALRFQLTKHTELTKISKDLEALIPKKDWKYVNNGLVLYGRHTCSARKHECSLHPLTKLYPRANTIWPRAH